MLSLLIFLGVTELVIRVYINFYTIYDIEMSRYATALKIPSSNPKIGHVHRPNSNAHLMNVDVHINSDGLRDREYPIERSDKDRIIFLGDSLTFAWGVQKSDAFEVLLEEALNEKRPTAIINFGIGNYNTEQQVHLFLEKGLKYDPDKVVIFYFINDAEPTPTQSPWRFFGYSRAITFFWSKIHAVLDNITSTKSYEEYYSDLYRDDRQGWTNTRDAFLKIRNVCRDQGIALQVIILPELHNLVNYPLAAEHKIIHRFLEQNAIEYLDLAPLIANERVPPHDLWVALDDAHPNARAHRLIAEYSLSFISGD